MKRRTFVKRGALLGSGYFFPGAIRLAGATAGGVVGPEGMTGERLYELFRNPAAVYRPFVRWWWNGDKIEKEELARELRLMKEAGIGGVEINPIKFPSRTDDMDKRSVEWLSAEWIDLLQFTLEQAAEIGLTCDLLVGSGWPFGAEYLQGEERSQIVVAAPFHLEGPMEQELSAFDFFKLSDPAISSPYAGRSMELLSVKLVPDPLERMDQIVDLSVGGEGSAVGGIGGRGDVSGGGGVIRVKVPRGKHVCYGLVKVGGFSEVINGAPGANGPVLNHYNEAAVKKYLNHMSDTIQQRIGPLTGKVRAFFTDSMELEGANWCADMAEEFRKRRGYDLMPYLPFLLYKPGGLGNVYDFSPRLDTATEEEELARIRHNYDYAYGVGLGAALKDVIERVRYDFDVTKSDLIRERFIRTYTEWCKANKVLSRVQAYGRGYYPLEGSWDVDLPECETWVKAGLGVRMSEVDPRIGRAYTMINKFVSSAAHLRGKRHISCEELTNTDVVFHSSLELLKVAGDQSTISGVTHPVFHGFNYSPPDAPFPGWIRYGTFFNERNTWWPYFRRFTDYKARLSALLQQAEMFADIAILPPIPDLWSLYGAQNEPFPSLSHPPYLSLLWESIHRNGSGCDYVSEQVIRDAQIKDGWLCYGPRKYSTLFLADVERIEPATAGRLYDFVSGGGRIFCIGRWPNLSPGLQDFAERDNAVREWVAKMRAFGERFILLERPDKDFLSWYQGLQQRYALKPYVVVDRPNVFVTQVRYTQTGKGAGGRGNGGAGSRGDADFLLFINSHLEEGHSIELTVSPEIMAGRQAWIWDAETGERYRVETGVGADAGKIGLDLSPADAKLIVFDKMKKGRPWRPVPVESGGGGAAGGSARGVERASQWVMKRPWAVEGRHVDGTVKAITLEELKDLKDVAGFTHFAGTAVYHVHFFIKDFRSVQYLNLGKVAGISEVSVNGRPAGTQWWGRRILPVSGLIHNGDNELAVSVTTNLGNYMRSLTDNPVAQKWTTERKQNQALRPMGLLGPVTLY